MNHKGEKFIANDGNIYEMSCDDVVIWGYAPYRQEYGQVVYGMWNEQVFPMNKAKSYGPSIDWGGPWQMELSLRTYRSFKWGFGGAGNEQSHAYVPPASYIVDESIGATAVNSTFSEYSNGAYQSCMSLENPLTLAKDTFWNPGNKYSVGDTMYLHRKRTYYFDGKMVRIDTTTTRYR